MLPAYVPGSAKAYVESKGWKYRVSGSELNLQACPFCQKSEFKFYLNDERGVFSCKHGSCSRTGNLYVLQKEMGDAPVVQALPKNAPQSVNIPKRYPIASMERYEEALANDAEAMAYLATRGITPESAKRWHLGFKAEKGRRILVIPYITSDGMVADVKYRALDPDASPKYWRMGGGESILYGEHLLPKGAIDTLYLCEGEIDAITLAQQGYGPVLSTTAGAGTFKPRWYDIIVGTKPKRIIICYDPDPAGQKGAEDLLKKFDEYECSNVVLPDGLDVNEFFFGCTKKDKETGEDVVSQPHSKHEFDALIAAAAPPEIEGVRSISSVFDELETQMFLGENAFVGIPSAFPELNAMIAGGYWNGFLITVTGIPGTGKTSFVLQDLLHAAEKREDPSYLLCLEMQEHMMLRKIIEHKFHIPMLKQTHADVQMARRRLEHIPFWMGSRVKDIDSMEKAVRQAVKRYDLKVMAFDNVNFFVRSAQNEASELAVVMRRLKDLAVELGIPIIVIAQPTKLDGAERVMTMNDLKGSSALQSDSDVIVILHRKPRRTNMKDFGSSEDFHGNQSPLTLLRVEKARWSPGGQTYMYFDGGISTFRSLTDQEREQIRGSNVQGS